MELDIRWMLQSDWSDVLAIEEDSRDDPWDRKELRAELKRFGRSGMVCELGDTIAGFMVYGIGRHGIEAVRFAVHPLFRRTGIGTAMMDRLKRKMSDRRTSIEFAVPDSMLAAHLFLRSAGFRAGPVIRRSGMDDVYLFAYKTCATEPAIGPARDREESW